MGELVSAAASAASEEGTKIGRFLADRGIILLKETRPIGSLRCQHGYKIEVGTIILTSTKNSTRPTRKTFGVRFDVSEGGNQGRIGSLDFDEIAEFANALAYFHAAAGRIANERRDYTEATFSTKDGIQVGFYQTVDQDQHAFFTSHPAGKAAFMSIDDLMKLKALIDQARVHLAKKGAEGEEGT